MYKAPIRGGASVNSYGRTADVTSHVFKYSCFLPQECLERQQLAHLSVV